VIVSVSPSLPGWQVRGSAPAAGGHADGGQLHGVRGIQQGPEGGGGRRAPLGVLPPEQLAGGLPEMTNLVLHCLHHMGTAD
jgi:hypothetical protein